MAYDQSNHIYALNRCLANLKLGRYAHDRGLFLCRLTDSPFRWDEAEADATKALDRCPRNLKALFRRGKACKELGKWDQARVGKDSSIASKASCRKLIRSLSQTFRCTLTTEAIRRSVPKSLRPSQTPKGGHHPIRRLTSPVASTAVLQIFISRITLQPSSFRTHQPFRTAKVYSPPEEF